ncbi:hypothetical protein BTW08_14895 [Salinicola sp. MH3R3-1]|uniref:DUF3253 domain-containing protein n=1 Tax=Salinicola sp. MH3R3-1 TaxID=1928762 RepID=UPI00094F25D1|nr:DUF3253 domain-containing protein [Salinicola sp. MH3R3-1]OLO06947.1 hypothetical protein BTW08_14895 [Salinicola sp. MH3R3-1]
MTAATDSAALSRAILSMAASRGSDKTFCPSEVARQLSDDWRPLMVDVRDCARELAQAGYLRVSQKGRTLSPDLPWQGPIRLQLKARPNGR